MIRREKTLGRMAGTVADENDILVERET